MELRNQFGSAKQLTRAVAQELIDHKEKYCCQKNQDQSHDGRHNGFTPGRPDNFRNFCPHLLEKCEWIDLRHDTRSLSGLPGKTRPIACS